MDWAEATYEVDFFKKYWFWDGRFCSPQMTLGSPQITLGSPQITLGSPQITHGSPQITQQGVIFEYFGGVLENGTFAENPKKCEMENDADGI